eukprot:scaffold21561_cov90-Isochrysis_galbana.AAC.2
MRVARAYAQSSRRTNERAANASGASPCCDELVEHARAEQGGEDVAVARETPLQLARRRPRRGGPVFLGHLWVLHTGG